MRFRRDVAAAAVAALGLTALAALAAQQPRVPPTGSSSNRTGARGPAATVAAASQAADTKIVVYKSPTCGCCGKWIEYLRANGFTVEVHDQDDISSIKRGAGVPAELESCHTAQIGGYAVEGHVPVEDIRRMLREHPAIAGISAPGMPGGAPGMGTGGGYEVKSFTRDGRVASWARH